MTDDTQPEALRLANVCSNLTRYSMDAHLIAAELCRQHARIAELEAELEAVGAGGVSGPLMARASLSANAGKPVAWQYRSLRDNGAWFDCTKERFEMRCTQPEIWEPRALYAAPPTAGFTAADMATASAQGFRDGAASAMAGEPMAWMTFTEEGDPDMVFLDRLEACQYCEDDDPPKPLYLAAPPTAQAEGWTRLPEALRLAEQYDHGDPAAHGNAWKAAVCTELRRLAELEAQIEALSGVQALSAAPAGWKLVPVNPTPEMWKAAKSVPDPNPPYPPHYGLVWDAMLAASPTPPAEQQAQPGAVYAELHEPDATTVGLGAVWNRHSMRDFADRTHALRLQAAPKAAPQQEAQEPVAWLNPWRADQVTTDYDAYGERGIPLYTAPQPAPAPLSDDVVKDAARYRWLREQGTTTHIMRHRRYENCIQLLSDMGGELADAAIDAALAAQGCKCPIRSEP